MTTTSTKKPNKAVDKVKKAAKAKILGWVVTTILPPFLIFVLLFGFVGVVAVSLYGFVENSWMAKTAISVAETSTNIWNWFTGAKPSKLIEQSEVDKVSSAEAKYKIPWPIIVATATRLERDDYENVASMLKDNGWDSSPAKALEKSGLNINTVVPDAMALVADGDDRLKKILLGYQNQVGGVRLGGGAGSANYRIDVDSGVTEKTLNEVLGGALAGKGAVFIASARPRGIDPAAMAAISMQETGNGTAPAVTDGRNNVGGFMRKSGGLASYESVDASIDYMGDLLQRRYVSTGRNTLYDVKQMYAPSGAQNDPDNLNDYWLTGTISYLNKMGVVTSMGQGEDVDGGSMAGGAGNGTIIYPLPPPVGIVSELSLLMRTKKNCTKYMHKGTDIAAPSGTSIYAAHSGTITANSFQDGGAGNYVAVTSGDGRTKTVYMHMSRRSPLSIGTKVKQGDVIGSVGSTGGSTGAHLHFEVWVDGQVTHSENYIKYKRVKPGAEVPYDKSNGRCG